MRGKDSASGFRSTTGLSASEAAWLWTTGACVRPCEPSEGDAVAWVRAGAPGRAGSARHSTRTAAGPGTSVRSGCLTETGAGAGGVSAGVAGNGCGAVPAPGFHSAEAGRGGCSPDALPITGPAAGWRTPGWGGRALASPAAVSFGATTSMRSRRTSVSAIRPGRVASSRTDSRKRAPSRPSALPDSAAVSVGRGCGTGTLPEGGEGAGRAGSGPIDATLGGDTGVGTAVSRRDAGCIPSRRGVASAAAAAACGADKPAGAIAHGPNGKGAASSATGVTAS